jgi:hypothetical protein
MESKEIILLLLTFTVVGFSIYRKYIQKDKGKMGSSPRPQSGSLLSSHSKDDDYEPYSKK